MRYMMLYQPGRERSGPPSQQELADMGRLIDEMTKAGVLLATAGLEHSSTGVRIRKTGTKVTVTDGPFTKSKDLIAGFAIVEARSKQHAIELTRRFLDVVGEGQTEVRPMQGAPDLAAV